MYWFEKQFTSIRDALLVCLFCMCPHRVCPYASMTLYDAVNATEDAHQSIEIIVRAADKVTSSKGLPICCNFFQNSWHVYSLSRAAGAGFYHPWVARPKKSFTFSKGWSIITIVYTWLYNIKIRPRFDCDVSQKKWLTTCIDPVWQQIWYLKVWLVRLLKFF